MNSQLEIRSALNSKIYEIVSNYNTDNATDLGITTDNDTEFDPSGLSNYVACFYIPVVNVQLGKKQSPEEDEGIFQVSVYTKAKSGRYDIDQLSVVDAVRLGFRNAELTGISIDSISVNGGRNEESWFVRDISINWYKLS